MRNEIKVEVAGETGYEAGIKFYGRRIAELNTEGVTGMTFENLLIEEERETAVLKLAQLERRKGLGFIK